jgi:hypothetical protein
MKKVLYLQENAKVALISALTLEAAVSSVPVGLPHLVVESDDLPSKEDLAEFFDALTADFGNIEQPNVRIDMQKAKEITKERLRVERIKLFEKNDIILRDAMISNDKVKMTEAVAERDRLKNITSLVDNADTLNSLRKLHP